MRKPNPLDLSLDLSILNQLTKTNLLRTDKQRETAYRTANKIAKSYGFDNPEDCMDYLKSRINP